MRSLFERLLLVVLFISCLPTTGRAADVTTSDCTSGVVQTAITNASPGDTVRIHAGTCTWTETVTVNKAITLRGEVDCTMTARHVGSASFPNGISVPSNCTTEILHNLTDRILTWTCAAGTNRLAHIEFGDGGTNPSTYAFGTTCSDVAGTTFRMDHIFFNNVNPGAFLLQSLSVRGVYDHNYFLMPTSGVFIDYPNDVSFDGVGDYGDYSMQKNDRSYWGQGSNAVDVNNVAKALYWEDNVIEYATFSTCIDGQKGWRSVIRYNYFEKCVPESHGTQGQGRFRGQSFIEFYGNEVDVATLRYYFLVIRSGTGIVFLNNAINRTDSGAAFNANLSNYRMIWFMDSYQAADGRSPWDINDTGNNPYVPPITISSHNSGTRTMTFSGTPFAAFGENGLKGYSAYNSDCTPSGPGTPNTVCSSAILANTNSTLTVSSCGCNAGSDGDTLNMDDGDHISVYKVLQVMDGIGRGGGSLLDGLTGDENTGSPTTCGGVACPGPWNDQITIPVYTFGNVWSDTSTNAIYSDGESTEPLRGSSQNIFTDEHVFHWVPGGAFDGSTGVGYQTTNLRGDRPMNCTTGTAYWSTDQGGNWNTSNGSANDGTLDICTSTNNWTDGAYTPFTYPHSLINDDGGGLRYLGFSQQPGNITSGSTFSPAVAVTLYLAGGTPDVSATGTITLTMNGCGAGLTGATTNNSPSNGVWTFSGLGANGSGTDCRMTATISNGSSGSGVQGDLFNVGVIPTGTPSRGRMRRPHQNH